MTPIRAVKRLVQVTTVGSGAWILVLFVLFPIWVAGRVVRWAFRQGAPDRRW